MRHLLPALDLCSLACSVALAGLWVVSWWRYPYVQYADPGGGGTVTARCEDGVATVVQWGSTFGGARGVYARLAEPLQEGNVGRRMWASLAGFYVIRGTIGAGRATIVAVPLWAPIVLGLIPPVARAWRRKRRGARGFPVEATDAAYPK